jgi:hypothetical protein
MVVVYVRLWQLLAAEGLALQVRGSGTHVVFGSCQTLLL